MNKSLSKIYQFQRGSKSFVGCRDDSMQQLDNVVLYVLLAGTAANHGSDFVSRHELLQQATRQHPWLISPLSQTHCTPRT